MNWVRLSSFFLLLDTHVYSEYKSKNRLKEWTAHIKEKYHAKFDKLTDEECEETLEGMHRDLEILDAELEGQQSV